MTFLNELIKIREDHMKAKNAEYKKVENEVIQEALKSLNPNSLKNLFREKVKGHIDEGRIDIRYEFSIDKLFKNKYEKEGPPVLELWHCHGRGYAIGSRLYRQESDNYKEWKNHFFSISLQPVLKKIKEILPDILISCDLECYHGQDYKCVLYMQYSFPPMKL